MDAEPPKEDSSPASQPAPTSQAKSKRPNQALYVPKKHQPSPKDKAQSTDGVKPRPRPRYTDKSRKNVKNRKDKAAAAGGAEERPGTDVKDGELQETQVTPDSSSLQVEAASPPEEQGADESWDTLFDDDGDFLDPHLLEEVRVRHQESKVELVFRSQHHFCPYSSVFICVSFCATLEKLIIDLTLFSLF